MIADAKEREQALDISNSFIVQAPAGSGKTELLTNRYLKLLAHTTAPEHIVALTFTKKAVAELKLRIIHSLELAQKGIPPVEPHKQLNYQLATEVLAQDKKHHWNLLLHTERIQVITLDSLAAKITHNYHLPNDVRRPDILPEYIDVYTLSAEKVLKNIEQSVVKEHIVALLAHLDNNTQRFVRLLAQMLQAREKWLAQVQDKNMSHHSVRQTIENITRIALEELAPHAQRYLTPEFFTLAAINTQYVNFTHLPQTLAEWLEVAELCITRGGALRKQLTKKDGFNNTTAQKNKEFKAYIAEFSQQFVAQLHALRALPNELDAQFLEHIVKVLIFAEFELQQQFEELDAVDYTHISLLAKEILQQEISDIALSLDTTIEHILLDEFQDTSWTQLHLLISIISSWQADAHKTLFIVGDPMQSIYLFRGAQVEVFLTVRDKGIAHIKPISLVLRSNFRSQEDIVHTNNEIFSKVFPRIDNENEGQIAYAASNATHTDKTQSVFVHPFAKGEETKEIEMIVQIIKENPHKNIAILTSKKTDLTDIAQSLLIHSIAFSAPKIIKFADNMFVQDLLSICTILLDKRNKLAWLALLRSPYVGLELAELLELAESDDIYAQLHTSSSHNARSVGHLFIEAFTHIGTFGLHDTFMAVVSALDIVATASAVERKSLDIFAYTLAQCEEQTELTLEILTHALAKVFVPTEASNVVLMNIHQSKGLEFDIVILPKLGSKPPKYQGELLYVTEFAGSGVLFAPRADNSKIYDFLKQNYIKRMHFERMRVLYVAMSRAKEQLHLSAAIDIDKCDGQSLLFLLKPHYTQKWQQCESVITEDIPAVTTVTHFAYTRALPEKYAPIPRPECISSLKVLPARAQEMGVLLHHFLQYEHFFPTIKEVQNVCNKHRLGLAQSEYQTAIELLHSLTHSGHFDFIFKNRLSTLTEKEYVFQGKTYRIDRSFVEDEVLYIIDFKTLFEEKLSDITLQHYTRQLDTYTQILKTIYNYPVRRALFIVTTAELIYV